MKTNKQTLRRTLYILLLTLPVAIVYNACSSYQASSGATEQSSNTSATNQNYLTGQVQMSIMNGGNTIYSDSNAGQSLIFEAGTNYELNLNATGFPSGTQFSLQMTDTSVPNGSSETINLNSGDNTFSVSTPGDYAWQLVAAASGYQSQTKNYLADVTCQSPTFTTLGSSSISVSEDSNNLYNFSANISGANGMGPYQCEWDPTGTGIADTGWVPCTQTLSNFYVNYVATRNVGVLVQDSCGTVIPLQQNADLNYSVPAMGQGNVFIFGQISNEAGIAASDARVNGVTYLATNEKDNDIVQPNYSNGGGSFEITASQNYQQQSSQPFGMDIQVKGLGNYNVSNNTGTLTPSSAYVSSVTYTTDEIGDGSPALKFTSTSCQSGPLNAKSMFVAGQPCAGGESGDTNQGTVEVYGPYSCQMSDGNGDTFTLTGQFDGLYNLVDSCYGGGGGGGGVPPIDL